jgi:hypothetical protein
MLTAKLRGARGEVLDRPSLGLPIGTFMAVFVDAGCILSMNIRGC